MQKRRVWTLEKAMIGGEHLHDNEVYYYHIRCDGQGRNRIVVEFVSGNIGPFLVAGANLLEKTRRRKNYAHFL